MTFEEWYDKTYPDSVGKYDGVNVACRSAAAFAWDASRVGLVDPKSLFGENRGLIYNVDFEYCRLKDPGSKTIDIQYCTFDAQQLEDIEPTKQTISRVIEILKKAYDDGATAWNAALEYSIDEIKKEFNCTEKSYSCSE